MRSAVAVAVALLITWAFETFFDLGVLVALIIAAIALVMRGQEALAYVMPIAGWFAIDSEWAKTTVILYAAFVLFAVAAGVIVRRRPPFISAAAGAFVLIVEILRR